ncbi:50S ribosomal protein L33 [Bacillus carboniphilus]|uniref:Large ribosomal subunit protein bL33 n=1 Tax=Bacillus carboniphilus TaxID=86663 RepID=A0ABY9JRD6_9BACI|nr:50S ribosomal protein L33 [Bacillus carboniphilus]WLR41965.1 50S ribosomal protein L33 [Bacillus carboniphilus]
MRKKVILACTACGSRNYSTNKNVTTTLERLEANKYCDKCKSHMLHRETK